MCGGKLTESVLYACLRLCTGASPVEGSIWGQEVEYSDPSCLPPLSICIPLEPTWFVTGIKDARKNCMLVPQQTPYWKGVKQSHSLLKSFSGNLGHLLTPTNRFFETRTPLKVIVWSNLIYMNFELVNESASNLIWSDAGAIILIKTFGSSWDKKMSLKIFFGPGAWFIRQILSLRAVRCVSATHMGSITVHYQQRTWLLSSARYLTG